MSFACETRGQSETLGFVFIFALITLAIGVTFTAGIAGLDDARQAEQVNNVERGFDVLSDNVADVARRGATSRATELRTAGGTVQVGEAVTFTVEATNSSDSTQNASVTTDVRPIVYEASDGTKIVYSNGAVLREEDENAFLLSDPNWLVDDQQAVLPVIATFGSPTPGTGTTVLVVTELQSRSVPARLTTGSGDTAEVEVTVNSSRAGAWDDYFERQGFTAVDGDPTDGNVTYEFETDDVYAPQTSVDVDLSS